MLCEVAVIGKKKSDSAALCGGELKTLRTLADGRAVRRERRCAKCGAKSWTIEMYESDVAKGKAELAQKLTQAQHELRQERYQTDNVRAAIDTLAKFAGMVKN